MTIINNPSLRLSPRHEPADVIPMKQETSLIDWLEASGRMMPRDKQEAEELSSEPDLDIMDEETNYNSLEEEQEEEGAFE